MIISGMTNQLRYAVILLGLVVGAGLACAPKLRPASLFGPSQPFEAKDYLSVLKTWTRSTKVYGSLDTKLFVDATLHSPEFRRVFALAFPDIYGQGGEVTRRELVDLSGGIEQYVNFFISAYTAETKWNDFNQPDSIWRLTLSSDEGVVVSPAQIIQVKIDANLKAVYPHIDGFDRAYLIRFPLTDPMQRLLLKRDTQSLTLRAASALGVADLTWDLEPLEIKDEPLSLAP